MCPCGCGSDLSKQTALDHETRQVFDLPPQKLIVTEHQVEIKRCSISGKLVHAPWPEDVTASVQYGPNSRALLVYLNSQQFVSLNRIDQMCFDLFGQHVSEQTILNTIKDIDKELILIKHAVKKRS